VYQRKKLNWVKHLDFILLDVLSLHIAFILAYITRNGWQSPYSNANYITIAFIYTFSDIIVCVLNNSMEDVLKRGFYLEFVQTLKHICLVELTIVVYLFSVKQSDEFSRIVIYLLAGYYLIISYSIRLFWKRYILSSNRKPSSVAYYITTSDRAKKLVDEFISFKPSHATLRGVCILDKDCVGQKISRVPVTANSENILSYLRDKWVDEVFISVPMEQGYPLKLVESLMDMGIVVHVDMEHTGGQEGQKQIIESINGKTVLTISNSMASTIQIFVKRLMDIIGGLIGCVFTCVLTLIIGPIIYFHSRSDFLYPDSGGQEREKV